MKTYTCKQCGAIDAPCYRRICIACREANRQVALVAQECESVGRCRNCAEIFVEAYMKKHGPDADELSPRQYLALDRTLKRTRKQMAKSHYPILREFHALTFCLAYRMGLLTPVRWDYFRHLHVSSRKYDSGVMELASQVLGISVDYKSNHLPALRAAFEGNMVAPMQAPINRMGGAL